MQSKLAVTIASLASVGLVWVGAPVSVSAHHAFAAEFDANSPLQMTGTVTKVEWVNPHVWIRIDVEASDGTVEQWAIEAGTPSVLFRRGFTRDALLPGTEIVVEGYRAKDRSNRANGKDLTFSDGRKMFVGSSGTGAPYELTPDNERVQ